MLYPCTSGFQHVYPRFELDNYPCISFSDYGPGTIEESHLEELFWFLQPLLPNDWYSKIRAEE
jgi:hypothetical protein